MATNSLLTTWVDKVVGDREICISLLSKMMILMRACGHVDMLEKTCICREF